jgi:hypothetical protein
MLELRLCDHYKTVSDMAADKECKNVYGRPSSRIPLDDDIGMKLASVSALCKRSKGSDERNQTDRNP